MRLHLVVLTAFSFAFSSSVAFAGGAITSGTTTAGTVSGPSYIDAWTFSGTSGNRIVITAITTSGSLNTNIVLKAPGGAVETTSGSGDRLDWQLASTGTYTVQIQDYALANAGDYAIGFLNVTAGPLTGGGDTDGGPIVSADVKAGTMSGPADLDAFTFSGTMGNRILIDCVATAGPGFNTEIVLYPPGGGPFLTYTIGDRLDVQLTSSGTWTAVIEDYGDDAAGSYSLSLLNVTAGPISNGADPDGGAIGSNEIKTGQFQDGVDFDAYTFFGFAGTRVLISAVTTGGSANTNTTLFPPGGVAAVTSTSADAFDWQLPVSGTYTIVVEDLGNDNTGTYTVSMVNITSGPLTTAGDPDGGPLTSSDVKNGTISGPGDFDVFTFQGNFGDRVIIDAVETAGVGFNTIIALYAPNGGPYATYTAGNRLEFQVNVTGTWAVVIEDNGLDTPGSYALSFLNVTTGPLTKSGDPDGGPIASNEIRSGAFQQGVDFDGYTFNGNAGQRIIFTAVATGGGSQNTNITLYPPGGGPAETGTSADQIDWQLAATGTYTVVVEDVGNDDTGTYTVSYVNLTAGPLTDGSDADGGPITSAAVKSGTISGVADLDAFTFSGNSGDRVLIDAVATAGASFNTVIVLYPPNGGSYVTYTGGDRLEYQLNATGTWTILIEDNGADTAGSYDLSLLNITSGPTTSGSDPDGGVLVSNTMMNGQFNQGVDFDAYTFTATAGNRVILTGVITGGTANTNLTLYPPNGGPAETGTSGDAIDWQVAQTGTYTLVLEDVGDDNTGTYTVSYLNLTAGPLTDGTDPDGGPITSAGVKTGTISGTGDLDAFTFTGNLGDRVLIDAVATSGASFNTVIVLYPPNGGSYAAYTGADRVDYQLTATGTWTILIEDNGLDNAGDYELSLLNITSGPITSGSDTDGGPIVSNEIKNGQFNQGVDFDAYTFNGFAGQRILFVAVATGVGGHNTNISLYPPGGRPAETGTSGDALDAQLQRSGIYTVVVEDVGNNNTGTYTCSFLNISAGPLANGGDTNGGAITSNQVVSGTISGVADVDGYTFAASFGQRILVDAVATAGAGFNTYIAAYPPGGGPAQFATGGDRLDFEANASGIWTVLIEDNGNDTPGSYTMSLLNITAGPYSGNGETDGGTLQDNVSRAGSIYSVCDSDGYTFFGITGMNANITATATSGTLNTQIALYPPNGGAAILFTTTDNVQQVLPADGYYTLVIEDYGEDETGNYSVKVDLSGGVTGVHDTPPVELALHPGVPSPFSQTTRIDYELPANDHVRLEVYDVTGARIRTLFDGDRGVGRFDASWDGRADNGERVASGVYYIRMQTRADVKREKVVLIR